MSRNNSRRQPQHLSFGEIQSQADDYKKLRDELNEKTKQIFKYLNSTNKEIEQYRKEAKDLRKNRDEINQKIKELKKKKYKLIDKIKELKNQRNNLKSKDKVNGKNYSLIKKYEAETERLERSIETDQLTIKEENRIIERITELAEKRKELLKYMEENDELYQTEKDIDSIGIELDNIKIDFDVLSKESQEYHEKMITLYKEIDYIIDKRKFKEEELINNKIKADEYHELFIKMLNQKKRVRKPKKLYAYKRQMERKTIEDEIIKKNLAAAIEKQKKGQKLNMFEARLLLERGTKEK
ncbi:MAG: hypothetical protein KAX10_03480 [Candidatus Lokiarchaeota archaeon]|nr:hypothetical protein [Candidatus Lokiarchaeota archaeon]